MAGHLNKSTLPRQVLRERFAMDHQRCIEEAAHVGDGSIRHLDVIAIFERHDLAVGNQVVQPASTNSGLSSSSPDQLGFADRLVAGEGAEQVQQYVPGMLVEQLRREGLLPGSAYAKKASGNGTPALSTFIKYDRCGPSPSLTSINGSVNTSERQAWVYRLMQSMPNCARRSTLR